MRMKSNPIPRSDDLIVVGYFLSRMTVRDSRGLPKPPAILRCETWKAAYDLFFNTLGNGRTLSQFRHTLRNTRDTFDPLFENGRVGWLDNNTKKQTLSSRDTLIYQQWAIQGHAELERFVAGFVR